MARVPWSVETMGGEGEAPAAPAWWPEGGINRPPSPPAWWPEGGINPPARGGDARTVGCDGGPAREDDDGDESLASESHPRSPEEKTSSPSARRTSTDADPLGAPVVERNTSNSASPADDDRATERGPASKRRPAGFDPLQNLSEAWRFIRGDDFSSLAGMDEDVGLADAFGEHGGGDALTAAVDHRDAAGAGVSNASGVSKKHARDERRAALFLRRRRGDGDGDETTKRRTRGEDARTRSPTKANAERSVRVSGSSSSWHGTRAVKDRDRDPARPASGFPSEAARKTALQKKHGGGLGDVHKAVTNVLRLLAREMKPLGMEGVATFDPLSGLFLWRENRRFAAARKRAVRELYRDDADDAFGARGRGRDEAEDEADAGASASAATETETEPPARPGVHPEKLREKRFVDATLPRLKLGARHAAAAYGSLAALLENNSARDKAHGFVGAVRDAIVSGGDGDAAERRATEAAARSARVGVEDIVAADWVTLPFSPASYVAVDRGGETVVLAIRGTVSTGDLLTDAVSTSTPFLGGWAHSGMVMSAYQVCKTQLPAAAAALVENPGYAFLVTGHSMGAGVAAILAMLVHSGDADVLAAAEKAAREAEARRRETASHEGDDLSSPKKETGSSAADRAMAAVRDVKCHCFAAPSVCSLDLSMSARAHTVSVVAGKDVIPRLCYAAVRRLLRRLNAAAPSQPMMKAISAALGGRDKKNGVGSDDAAEPARLFGEEPALGEETEKFFRFSAPPKETATRRATPNEDADEDPSVSEDAEAAPGTDPNSNPPRVFSVPDASAEPEPEPEPKPETAPEPAPGPARESRESRCQGEWDDVAGERGLELRDHFASDFLVQPGFVIHLRHLTSDHGPTAEARHPTAFTEIPISTRMMADHVPMVYQSAIEAVVARAAEDEKRAAAEKRAFAEETARYGPGGLRAYVRGREALDLAREAREARRRRRRRRRRKDEAEMRSALARAEARATSSGFAGDDAEKPRDPVAGGRGAPASTSPARSRLWANVRRVVGVSDAEATVPGSSSGSDDTSDVASLDDRSSGDSGAAARTGDAAADEDAWSEDDEADLLAAVAEMLGLDVSDPMPEEREASGRTLEGENADPRRATHRRQNSWGLGRLGRFVGALKRDADAMFTGADSANEEEDAFEVDGYVAQARAVRPVRREG